MKRLFPLLFASLIAGAAAASGQVRQAVPESLSGAARIYDHWTVFLHPGSGYELPVPPRVRALGVPEEAVEAVFVSPDGNFEMKAWGGLSRQSPRHQFEAEWKLALTKPGRILNYQRKAESWFVVSGTYDSGIEFYEKFTMRGNHVGGFTLAYPRARLAEFEPWVVGIEKGFRLVPASDRRQESAPSPPTTTVRTPARPAASGVGASDRPRTSTRDSDSRVDATPPRRSSGTGDSTSRESAAEGRSDTPADTMAGSPSPEKKSTPLTAAERRSLPVGKKVAGKPGYVYSPFDSDERLVEVEGFASGTLVKCPYTMKMFRVP